jgi:glutamate-1-semialdehyde 2,1-aminomutase
MKFQMDTGTHLTTRIDRAALAALRAREEAAFAARTPKSRAWLEAGRASMPNGVPMAWMAGLYRHNSIAPSLAISTAIAIAISMSATWR